QRSPTAISTLSLHDALPICLDLCLEHILRSAQNVDLVLLLQLLEVLGVEVHGVPVVRRGGSLGGILQDRLVLLRQGVELLLVEQDRKSTRLNSSHVKISYAV